MSHKKHATLYSVTLNNASDYRANGLLSDYIGWTNGLTDYRTRVRVRGPIVPVSPIVRCIIKCDPFILDYKFHVSYIFTLLVPMETGINTQQLTYSVFLIG